MFLNRRKNLKEDAVELFNSNNFGFNTGLNSQKQNEEPTKAESKSVDEDNKWAQWWNVGNENENKIKWSTKDKVVLGVELALIVYFMLWRLGLVPIF